MKKKSSPKQFVIQQHTTPEGVHWDLMLEMDGTLWTWRLTVPPAEIENEPVTAERINDHPLRFLTYEGPVQNNTGNVTLADKGTFLLTEQTNISLAVAFAGKILGGTFRLCKPQAQDNWELKKVQPL